MQIFFIEQALKSNIFKRWFNIIELKDDKITINNSLKCNLKKKIKLVKTIEKILNDNNVDMVLIDNNLKRDEELIQLIKSTPIKLIERKIYK